MGNYLHEETDKGGTKDFLLGAMIGGVIGAAAALWLSPKSGTALRESVTNQTAVIKEKAGNLQLKEKVSDIAQMTKEKTNTLTQTITQQSSEALAKIKGINRGAESEVLDENPNEITDNGGLDSIQKMLEETKKAFDETEKKLNH
ncbi:YtxH domain-containing protein [Bacillus sp. T3]|uniref:YtxH domain-containing protein n=1 Tax=Bacillus sp. T3 TaxID=467262 RepID=UPI0029822D4A|nr:YtxH domain-containing protein [Bacillus sp. T3]